MISDDTNSLKTIRIEKENIINSQSKNNKLNSIINETISNKTTERQINKEKEKKKEN